MTGLPNPKICIHRAWNKAPGLGECYSLMLVRIPGVTYLQQPLGTEMIFFFCQALVHLIATSLLLFARSFEQFEVIDLPKAS